MSTNDAKTVPVPNLVAALPNEPTDPAELARLTYRLVVQMTKQQEADRLQWQSLGKAVGTLDGRVGALEGRVSQIETEVRAGVHISDAPDRVLVPSLPPMRPHLDTHESINAVALRQDVLVTKQEALDVKQDAQLKNQDEQKTMLQKMRTAQRQNALMALAAAAGVFFANYANNCHPTLPQVPQHVLAPAPYVAPAPAQTPPPPPSH